VTEAQLRDWLTTRVARAAGVEVAEVDVNLPFRDQGVDSVTAAQIAGELAYLLEAPLDTTVLFEHPSISRLVAALCRDAGQLETSERSRRRNEPHEPIAVVGLACRMPGAPSVESFWKLLEDGHDAIGPPPAGRWPPEPELGLELELEGIARGGFLTEISGFDVGYFRIPVEEALRMDPQQRLLLEVAVECFEDAGVSDDDLRGSAAGVFVGISSNEYGYRQSENTRALSALTPTGNALSIAANRVSYVFDLRGPSIAVDTACSSSLVALHLACRSLRAGECDVALVAGINLLLDPHTSIALAKAGFLAPDGLCKTFDASADGYVRAEGCGAALLKPLSQARADGDRVYALVAGSAVNQDGRTNGLTAPNPTAQEHVLRAAYRDAQIDPSTASYVECHGTGTFLGDPIELRALSRVLCGAERERRLLVGSVKTNVGHLEAAAGMAGFIKTSLAIHAGSIPASLNFKTPNPNVDIDGLGMQVVTERTHWPEPELVAGVSSFGFGGTNAHVVMTTPQEHPQRVGARHAQPLLLPVSAKSAAAFSDVARAFADHTSRLTPDELAGFAASVAIRRNHYAVRDAVVGSTPAELASRLGALTASAAGDSRPARGPRVAFVFSGHGSQLGAARSLLAQRLFRGVIERCDEILAGREPSIKSLILDDGLAPGLDDTALAQPVIVAIQVALVEMLSAVGVVPAAVVGHSVGEISAAYAARAFTLDEAIGLAARRGSAMAPTAGRGRMLALGVDEATARDMIAGKERDVVVAAVNGPAATVLSGRVSALGEVEREARSRALFAQWLPIDYPFHSNEMEAAATEIADECPRNACGEVAFYSTVVGGRGESALTEPGYWARNVRQPVRLADAVREMIDDGIDILFEIGPTPVLQAPLRQIAQDRDGVLCACVHRAGRTDESGFLEGLAALYRSGVDLDWSRLWSERQQFVPFPKYRWQHTPLLLERGSMRKRPSKREHVLLGARIDVAGPSLVLENEITSEDPGFLADHRVSGMVVFPASGYVELIVTAARYAGLTGALAVEGLDVSSLLVLGSDPIRLQTIAIPDGSDAYRVEVYSRPSNEDDNQWVPRAAARAHAYADSMRALDVADLQRRCLEQIPKPTFYGALADAGLHYGPAFRQLEQIWRTDGEAFAHVPPADPAFSIDPRLLDAAFQLVAAAADVEAAPDGDLWVPIGIERLVVADPPPATDVLVHARLSTRGTDSCDVEVLGLDGEPFAVVSGLRLRRVLARGARTNDRARAWTYKVGWLETENRIGTDFHDETAVLVGTTLQSQLAGALDGAGARVEALSAGIAPTSDDEQLCATDSYRSRLREVRDRGHQIRRLIYVASRRESAGPGRAVALCQDLVALIQAVSFSDGEALPELWIVTSGAHVIGSDGSDGADPFAAAIWGVAKVVPFENPALSVRCVDIDGAEASLRALVGEMLAPSEDAEIAIRDGKRYVRRILPGDAEPLASAAEMTADGMYVVTGGTGGIGPHLLAWLARRGARHIAVLSRGGLPDDLRADALRAEPSTTLLDVRCDVSVRAEVESALVEIRSHGLPICGVVHAAGVLADGALLSLSSAAVAEPLAPKVAGACWLDELTADDPVAWYVFFSSAAGVLGSPGQANYAAANACLDALASSMRVRGRPAVSIGWGPWAVGMAAGLNRTGSSLSMSPLNASDAIASLELAISAPSSNALVLPFDLRDLLQYFPPGLGFTLFEKVQTADMAHLRNVGRQAGPVGRPALATEYVAARSELEERIAQLWQLSLGIERIGVFDRFFELGGDSVFANQMIVEINQSLGVKIDANRAFEEFTVAHIAALAEESLLGRLAAMTDEEAEALLARSE
jgi:acyl transferase domain-containing protein/acyl carrier protein